MSTSKTFNQVKINVEFEKAASTVEVPGGNAHAANLDSTTVEGKLHQDLAVALGRIQNWYDNWHSVVWTGNAAKVNGKTVAVDVPSGAVFTDTTYSLSGAYGSNNDTWVTTLTPSSGTASTSTVPTASTSVYGITKLSSATNDSSTTLAATPAAVKSAYDLASGKSTVSFTRNLTSGTKVGTITINGTDTDLYCQTNTDTKVTQNILATTVTDTYPLLVSYYKTGVTTTTAQTVNRVQAIYVKPSAGEIYATNFVGTVNGKTISGNVAVDVPADAVFTDTTYSAGTGLSLNGTTINHSNSVTAGTAKGDDSKTLTFGGTFTIPTVTYDSEGHITAKGTTTMTMPANPNSDTKVNVTKATTTKAYLLGTSTAPTSSAQAVTSVADDGVFLTTTAGRLQMGSLAITSGSYANIVTSASLSSANVTQTLPAKTGTVLNSATTSFTQTLTSGTKIGTIKINDVETDLYCQTNTDNDTKVTQNIKSDNKNYPLLLSYYESSSTTTTAQTANRASGIYANPSTGTITATNFAGTINGYTISGNVAKAVPSNAVFTDTTYTFESGASGAYFKVTPSTSGASQQTVYIKGLGTMAFESSGDYVPAKPDGTHDLIILDSSTHVINSLYLPSYVDDVVNVIYDSATGKIYDPDSPTTEIQPQTGKIYVDVSTPTKSDGPTYRWSGTAFISLKSPTVDGVANVVAGSTNGQIVVSYNDGSTASTVTVYSHPNLNHIPTGGSSGKILGWSSSGTAAWIDVPAVSTFTGAPDSTHNGTSGVVPAPSSSTYNATKNRHFLRSDATWSDDPVIEGDVLTLNVV